MNTRKVIVSLVVILVLGVGGFFGFRQITAQSASAAANLQTAQIERGTLETSVSAAGTIQAPQVATLVWRTTGIVGQINVAVGDTVDAGEVLMELNPNSLDPSVLQAQADLISAQETLETLLAGPTKQQVVQAQLAVLQAQEAVTTAQRSLNNVLSPNVAYYQEQYDRAQAALTAAQQNAEITNYQTSLRAAADALTNATNNLNTIKELDAQYPGYGAQRDRLKNAQAAYDRALQDYQTALYKLEQAQSSDAAAIADAQQALNTAQANLKAAQAEPDQAKVALYQAQLEVAKANLAQAQADLAELLAGPDPAEVAAAQAKIASAQATVNAVKLAAPFAGTVVSIDNRAGDSVDNNQTALVLADLSRLEIQVDVSEVDINSIVIGQEVSLTADAAPGQTFRGQVAEISVIGTSQQGVVTFPVTVVVPDPDPALKPGMTAAVAIVTDRRADVLLAPNRAIRVSGGQRTVTVLFEGQQISVPVTLGLSNESMSEIVSGQVRAGDTVVINSTASAAQNQSRGGFLFGGPFGP